MESRQFIDARVLQKRRTGTKNLKGSKYQVCGEIEGEKIESPKKSTVFLQRCNKYLR